MTTQENQGILTHSVGSFSLLCGNYAKVQQWRQGNEFGGKAVIQVRDGDIWKELAADEILSTCFIAVVLF